MVISHTPLKSHLFLQLLPVNNRANFWPKLCCRQNETSIEREKNIKQICSLLLPPLPPAFINRPTVNRLHMFPSSSRWSELLLNQNSVLCINQPITDEDNAITPPINWPDWWRILTSCTVIGSNE